MTTTDDTYHYYEPATGHGLAHDPLNSIVGPRPIGWVSTLGSSGVRNLAPYSFFNLFCYKPPILGFCSTSPKDSLRNSRESGEFVWNLATRDLAERMNVTSGPVPYEVDEFELAGLTPAPSRHVRAARVAESGVNFECKVTDVVNLKTLAGSPSNSWVVFGEVVAVHIRRSLLKDGLFDTFGAGVILRGGGPSAYAVITPESRFDIARPR